MSKTAMQILIVGRQQQIIDAARTQLDLADVDVHGATTVALARDALRAAEIEHVFMGPGLPISTRLEIVEAVFEESDTTSVHLKDFSRGPEGALDFVRGIVRGLRAEYHHA